MTDAHLDTLVVVMLFAGALALGALLGYHVRDQQAAQEARIVAANRVAGR